MGYQTIEVDGRPGTLTITLSRPEARNSIGTVMVSELHAALDRAQADPAIRMVVLRGSGGYFCTGMDLAEAAAQGVPDLAAATRSGEEFLGLLKRLTTVPRIVIAAIDGQAVGGGVGLVAASDFAFATPASTFSLPETLWGLLPCCVAPFLIRRVGFQTAYAMSLGTQPVTAGEAAASRLVDGVTEQLGSAVGRLAFRATKLPGQSVGDLKRYFRRMWFLTEEMERAAVSEFARLMSSDALGERLIAFARDQRFPWEVEAR
jgi:polyketide biosynthesis enoyl-CoA hydratase PksH